MGNSYIKGRGVLVGNFKKSLLRGTEDPVLWVWLKTFLPPVGKGTKSKTTHFLLSYFQLNTLKGIAKAPSVDLLRLNTLRATKTTFSP